MGKASNVVARVQSKYSSRSKMGITLIIENDPFSQKLFSHIIKSVSDTAVVLSAANIAEAREYIQLGLNIDLIVLDIFLDGNNNGLDILPQLREAFPDTPVIVTSSISNEAFNKMCEAIEPKPLYLKKPFSPVACSYLFDSLTKR